MNIRVTTYLIYLVISIGLTVWVARTLHKNGRTFLVDAFHGNETLADSVNHLLFVGFYLVNLGFVSLALKSDEVVRNSRQSIELLSQKEGMVLLVLGAMHFLNLYVFNVMRTRSTIGQAPPPVEPNAYAVIQPPFAPPAAS